MLRALAERIAKKSLVLSVLGAMFVVGLGAFGAGPIAAQEGEAAASEAQPALAIESVEVEPTRPGREVLCRLTVRIKNSGTAAASVFGFEVKVEGTALAVYQSQRYLQVIPAGETAEIDLFNFWSGESRRPAPSDGKLDVEVALIAANWVTQQVEDGVEVTTPGTAIEGLPIRSTQSVTLSS